MTATTAPLATITVATEAPFQVICLYLNEWTALGNFATRAAAEAFIKRDVDEFLAERHLDGVTALDAGQYAIVELLIR